MIDRLESIIFYFEGSCEICLANSGIEKYRAEVEELLDSGEDYSDEVNLRLHYAHALIEYKVNNIGSALAGWLRARDYAELTGNSLYLGKTYSFLSICYYIKGDREQEKYCFTLAEEILKKLKYYGELANHYINILWYKRYEKDRKEIIEYLDKAFDYVQMSGSMKNARIYLHLGYIYKTIFSDYTKCIGYLIKSNELCREFGFTEMESMTFHVLADVYSKIDRPSETIRIYTNIMNSDRFKNITPNLKAAILSSLAQSYISTGDSPGAGDCLRKLETAIPGVQTSIREQYRALMLELKAGYMSLGHRDNEYALELMAEAESIYEKHKQNFIVEEFPLLMASRKGDIYLALKDYDNALACYGKMRDLAEIAGRYELKSAYEKLARCYGAMGDFGASLSCYKNADGICAEILSINQDIQYETMYKEFIRQVSEQEKNNLEKQNSTLEQQGNIDSLTNVFNRNYLNRCISGSASPQAGQSLSILMADIDTLKKYNDIYGHLRGDEAVKSVAKVFKNRCRSTDSIIRYGGDEFLIMLENTSREDAINIANDLVEGVRALDIGYEYFGITGTVTASIGIATCPPGGKFDLEAMISRADRALYHSKSIGGDVVTHADML